MALLGGRGTKLKGWMFSAVLNSKRLWVLLAICSLMESASQAARAAVITAAEQGQQNESRLFAAWEAHGRGVASKLMARMG